MKVAESSEERLNSQAAEEAAGWSARPAGALSEANGARQKMAERESAIGLASCCVIMYILYHKYLILNFFIFFMLSQAELYRVTLLWV